MLNRGTESAHCTNHACPQRIQIGPVSPTLYLRWNQMEGEMGEKLGGEGGETVIGIYYVRQEPIFNKRENIILMEERG